MGDFKIYLIIVLEGIFNLKKKLILKKVKITFQRIIIKPILKCFTKKKKTKYGILLKIFIRKTLLKNTSNKINVKMSTILKCKESTLAA